MTLEGKRVHASALALLREQEWLRQDLRSAADRARGALSTGAVPTMIPVAARFALQLHAPSWHRAVMRSCNSPKIEHPQALAPDSDPHKRNLALSEPHRNHAGHARTAASSSSRPMSGRMPSTVGAHRRQPVRALTHRQNEAARCGARCAGTHGNATASMLGDAIAALCFEPEDVVTLR